ncbi:hypothetical protein DL93DRAFT_2091324 [Clavulina sp. PMI_390]|nr:hypothetical protein DL93DRAFT_2091324 [Clavulina sp. PMI_390]
MRSVKDRGLEFYIPIGRTSTAQEERADANLDSASSSEASTPQGGSDAEPDNGADGPDHTSDEDDEMEDDEEEDEDEEEDLEEEEEEDMDASMEDLDADDEEDEGANDRYDQSGDGNGFSVDPRSLPP